MKIIDDRENIFHVEMPWDSPMFGGNGDDGGLLDAVLGDPWIHRLGDVAHALDTSEKRVKLPHGSDDPPGLPGLPFLPVPEPVPVPLALASYKGGLPGVIPAAYRDPDSNVPYKAPLPPVPGTTQLLSSADRKAFVTWVSTLRPMGFGGKGTDPTDPANAYQLRTAGYPERLISCRSTTPARVPGLAHPAEARPAQRTDHKQAVLRGRTAVPAPFACCDVPERGPPEPAACWHAP
ncbi:hypothetical protein [Streptomyces sp. NPDC048192]|uniref:hypothetical protein n=1 Tax=Streptomyces sp. NPDC048192 TaxID=3365510 RepID=UPI00371E98D1